MEAVPYYHQEGWAPSSWPILSGAVAVLVLTYIFETFVLSFFFFTACFTGAYAATDLTAPVSDTLTFDSTLC